MKFSSTFQIFLVLSSGILLSSCEDDAVSTIKPQSLGELVVKPKLINTKFFSAKNVLIAPGTKWCGPGNRSQSYDDLGYNEMLDSCCRAHDHCFQDIPAGQTRFNLTNIYPFTVSHCDCDADFKQCLRKVSIRDPEAALLGNIYFNILGTKCFKADVPKGKCLKFRGNPIFGRCARYAEPESNEPVYQFFDNGPF